MNFVCEFHNHALAETLVCHPLAGGLSGKEKSLLYDITKKMVSPKDILLTMNDHDKSNIPTFNQIYNARQKYQRSWKCDRTEVQHLLLLLKRNQYVYGT